jgi:hypothetical protein
MNDEAQQQCAERNAFLVSLATVGETRFVQRLANATGQGKIAYFWTGGSRPDSENGFEWNDGSKYNYTNWQSSNPTSLTPSRDCIASTISNGRWLNVECTKKFTFVCKYYIPSTTPGLRTYFLKAEEVDWNYVPQGTNIVKGRAFNEEEQLWTENTDTIIGPTYIKVCALYI